MCYRPNFDFQKYSNSTLGKVLWSFLVITSLLPYFFQETGAENQAGKSKQNRSPTKYNNRWNLPEIYNISTSKKAISSTFHQLIHHIV